MGKQIIVSSGETTEVTVDDATLRNNMPALPTADQVKQQRIDTIQEGVLTIGHEHENRIRALEGKGNITLAQFKAAVKARLT